MKKFLATSALVVLSVGSAYAADLRPAPRPAPPPPVYSWTGLYWGVNVGYSWGEAKNEATLQIAPGVFGTASASRKVDGVIGGFQSGYNYQFGQWVWGFETDFQASGQKGSDALQIAAGVPPTFLNTEHKLTWFGTSRSRLGVLWTPNTLLYGTFGVAYGKVKEDAVISRGAQSASLNFKDVKAGWTAGAGVESDHRWRLDAPNSNTSTWTSATPRAQSLRPGWEPWQIQAAASPTTLYVSVSTISGVVAAMAADMDIEC